MISTNITTHQQAALADVDAFFQYVFMLSTPFYILTALASWDIVGTPSIAPIYIMVVTGIPCLAASILTTKQRLREVYSKSFLLDPAQYLWHTLALFLGPALSAVTHDVVLVTINMGGRSKAFQPEGPLAELTVVNLVCVMLLFIVMAAGEEIGWMAYTFESLKQERCNNNSLLAASYLGVIWALWHVPFFFFLFPPPLAWTIPCQVVTLIANRILLVWIYENSGSGVLAVILYHAADNATIIFSFDYKGSYPLVPCMVAVTVSLLVVILYDSHTMTKFRFKGASRPLKTTD